MEGVVFSSQLLTFPKCSKIQSRSRVNREYSKSTVKLYPIRNPRVLTKRVAAMNEVSAAADLGQAEVTWQIVAGAAAGVTPFVVAGIEFSKRIIAQRRCEACRGSGLVQLDNEYFRCPECGGFLPWQSLERFFTG